MGLREKYRGTNRIPNGQRSEWVARFVNIFFMIYLKTT